MVEEEIAKIINKAVAPSQVKPIPLKRSRSLRKQKQHKSLLNVGAEDNGQQFSE